MTTFPTTPVPIPANQHRSRRFGQVIGVHPEHRQEYLRLHAAVWPEVEAALTRANVRNYTIFIHDDLLFAYFEYVGDDLEADLASIAADPTTQRWWTHTDPCQRRLTDGPGGPWTEMTEVWHLD
ncbi:L-rhamnose mutarotase [Saccharothrix ecbatanensis]|uniref:L-rhamnose mutarotase n=1 Tax=Saccharothrix ecbatanensis TaxID=1105145 RepID=A0A7W9HH20_9PSEU|nr:L-rhamnose mutarotase [Saccharothrix ecbatanensis]MBB5801819.1 L-rhamnose mutarotase [Saccharothrix ecbatanensis]